MNQLEVRAGAIPGVSSAAHRDGRAVHRHVVHERLHRVGTVERRIRHGSGQPNCLAKLLRHDEGSGDARTCIHER